MPIPTALQDLWNDLWKTYVEPLILPHPEPLSLPVWVQPPAYMIALVFAYSIVMVLILIIALVALIDRGRIARECDMLRDENITMKEKLVAKESIANERDRLQDDNDFMSRQLEISNRQVREQSRKNREQNTQIRELSLQVEELSTQLEISEGQLREYMKKLNAVNSQLEVFEITNIVDNILYEGCNGKTHAKL